MEALDRRPTNILGDWGRALLNDHAETTNGRLKSDRFSEHTD
jgi:hypothetical protein